MSLKNVTKKILILLMFNVLLAASFYGLTIESSSVHEYAHKEIAENHGCIEYNMDVQLNGEGHFQCTQYANRPDDVKKQEAELHSINEIVSYNASGIRATIIMSITILMNALMMRWILDE